MTRKQFISSASAAIAGFASPALAAEKKQFRAALVKGGDFFAAEKASALKAKLGAGGFNVALVDVQDSIAYPSHPEIATKNSVATAKAEAIVSDWRSKGVDVVPLLDFTSCCDSWLGVYDRMICSKPYDKVVRDLIRDAYGIFGSPEYIHIGFSNEDQENHKTDELKVMRQGDLWMRYLIRTSGWVKETGARTWAWFDYPWGMKDFLQDCPRDIVYSNFKSLSDKRIFNRFSQVVKAGCDAVPFLHADSDADALAKLSEKRVLGIMKEVTA
jgi:hypothetical protein